MDKRKGLIAGYKKLGPIGRFLFWCAIVGLILSVLFFMVQQKTGATKKEQIAAQIDRDSKHKEEIEELQKINSKINIKNRPYLGIEKFSIERDNNHFTPMDYMTLYIKNYGGIPANEVKIFVDTFDEMKLKWKKSLPFKKIIPNKFTILPSDTLKFDKELLLVSEVNNYKDYDKWIELEAFERAKYFKQYNKYPRQDIYDVTVEIKYIGLQKQKQLFSSKLCYVAKVRDGEIIWSLNSSDIK